MAHGARDVGPGHEPVQRCRDVAGGDRVRRVLDPRSERREDVRLRAYVSLRGGSGFGGSGDMEGVSERASE